jgi:hypothetical protein
MTTALVPGGNVSFAQVGLNGEIVITLVWVPEPGADMDLSALLCTADGKVRSDDDLVFYNQPLGAGGAVRHVGKDLRTGVAVDRLSVHPARLPADVEKVVIAASIDGGGTFGSLSGLAVEVAASAAAPPAVRATCPRGPRRRSCSPRSTAERASGRSVPSARATATVWRIWPLSTESVSTNRNRRHRLRRA